MGDFPRLRRFIVSVEGYGEGSHLTTTRGKALADAWRSDVFGHLSFKDFLRVARCRLDTYQPEPVACTVGGKPALYFGGNRQYLSVQLEGRDFLVRAHPLDVQPEALRPDCYREVAA